MNQLPRLQDEVYTNICFQYVGISLGSTFLQSNCAIYIMMNCKLNCSKIKNSVKKFIMFRT